MRFSKKTKTKTAADVVNKYSFDDLKKNLLQIWRGKNFSARIADMILLLQRTFKKF